ncbi:MAG: DNA cytosine methyltransferase [Thermodesulfobacteriota bacterium]|nr:DNA cytosine methyltransferase [Thermodesulfobacteriota bacterium]
MRVGSLFSGIGGFDLGLEWAGMEMAWQVENDKKCCKILKKHWPKVTRFGDIKEIDLAWCSIVCHVVFARNAVCLGQRN